MSVKPKPGNCGIATILVSFHCLGVKVRGQWQDIKKELLENHKFRKLYEESQPEFEIAKALIRARIEKKLTQKMLAKKMKTTQSVISRVEQAKTSPSLSFLKRLASALDTTLQVKFK